jgi:hypothetical protein
MPQIRTHGHKRLVTAAPAEKPEQFARGRTCKGCGCELSIYNGGSKCWPCKPTGRKLITTGSMDNRPDVLSFQSLMEET